MPQNKKFALAPKCCRYLTGLAFAAKTQNSMRRETHLFDLQLLVNAVVQPRTGLPWTFGQIPLTVFATLGLITVLVDVRRGPHTRIHNYSPHRFIYWEMARGRLRHTNFLAKVPGNLFCKTPNSLSTNKRVLVPKLFRWLSHQVSPGSAELELNFSRTEETTSRVPKRQRFAQDAILRLRAWFLLLLLPALASSIELNSKGSMAARGKRIVHNVEQMEKTIPFITCEIALCQYVCELASWCQHISLGSLGKD